MNLIQNDFSRCKIGCPVYHFESKQFQVFFDCIGGWSSFAAIPKEYTVTT